MNTSAKPNFRRLVLCALLTLLGWSVFISIISTQHVVSGAFAWADAVQMALHQWLPWAVLSPFVFWLTLRFPIERQAWWLRVPLHIAAGAVALAACMVMNEHLYRPTPPPWTGNGPRRFDGPPPFQQREPDRPGERNAGGPPPRPGPRGRPWWFRVRFNAPIYMIILSLSHAVVYFQRSQQRGRRALELETRLAQAQLQALRMQINPHFLFNTLNAISTLVHSDPKGADEMIGSLSEMLRLSLDTAAEQEVPLQRELDFLNRYLEIERIRFGDRLRIEQNIAPDVQSSLVPTLILQPLVENSIRHGIEPKLAPCVIGLSAQRVGDTLCVSIRDTGVGLSKAAEAGTRDRKGIGLSNTRARLEALYGNRHRFVIQNDPNGGCTVELEMPFHTEPLLPSKNPTLS